MRRGCDICSPVESVTDPSPSRRRGHWGAVLFSSGQTRTRRATLVRDFISRCKSRVGIHGIIRQSRSVRRRRRSTRRSRPSCDGQEATASRYSCILIAGIIVAATVKTEEEEELSRVGRGSLASEAGSIRTAKSTLAPHECTK